VTGRLVDRAEYLIGISQPTPLSQRLGLARRVETLDRDRLGLELEVKRLEIRRRVQSAFATVLYGQRVIQARAEDVRIAENGVAVAKARLAAGDAIPAEVGQAEVELGRTRLALEQATSRHAQAIEALVTGMGDPTLHVESLEGSLEGPLALPTLELLATRLEQSPFIGAAEADIAVQRARIDLAETQRIPDVSLDLLYRRVGDVENTVDVGVRVPIPLFNRYQGRIREARADFVAAEARARSARNELARELQTSYRTLATAIAAAKLLREEILPRAENVLRSAETRYASGDISLTELLPIRRDWTRVRLDYLDTLQDVMQAWAALSPYLY
jgi:cobalt-zinc-cadmium efflux system outer membrane protein